MLQTKTSLRRYSSWITQPHVQNLQFRSTQTLLWVIKSTEALFKKESWKQLPTWNPQKQLNRAVLVMTRLCLRYFESILSLCSQSVSQLHSCHAHNRSECTGFGLQPPLRLFFAESNASTPCNSDQMKSLSKVWPIVGFLAEQAALGATNFALGTMWTLLTAGKWVRKWVGLSKMWSGWGKIPKRLCQDCHWLTHFKGIWFAFLYYSLWWISGISWLLQII